MDSRKEWKMPGLKMILGNERGATLAIALMLLTVLVLVGTTAAIVTRTDIGISGNYRVSEQAFYIAQAGAQEGRTRFRANSANPITDGYPGFTDWRLFIGTLANAQALGFNPTTNPRDVRVDSVQSGLNGGAYTVVIRHKTDSASPPNLYYWGDTTGDAVNERNTSSSGRNIYLITSYGSVGGANQVVEVECTKEVISSPSPVYTEAPTTIQGSSTQIIGTEGVFGDGTPCGDDPKRGIVTTQGTVTTAGNPTISGSGGATNDIQYNAPDIDVQALVDKFKGLANINYPPPPNTGVGYTSDQNFSDVHWGTPTLQADLSKPSTCNVSNIVYFNMNGTKDVHITGGSTGCGILIVNGDLEVNGGFSWYGIILVSGSVKYTGGGDKQITGSIISGGSVEADTIGGNAKIVYCTKAIEDQTNNQPLLVLSWREVQ